ncbi:MAG: hypothetical protein J6Z47_04340 [Bacteroidales bacterium]|nr:hypothetical protein [Bacteroidales bacterium]
MKTVHILSFFTSLLLIAGCSGGKGPAGDREARALPLNTLSTVPENINKGSVIPFEHALPSHDLEGRNNGTYNNVELAIPGVLTTQDTDLGMMMKWLRDNVQSGRHTVFVDGEAIPVYKNWIRDHVHTMKAFRHWEHNLRSYLDFTLAHQRPDGSFYELIKQMDDMHWAYVAEDDIIFFPEDNLYLARLDIESDIEYLVVEGAAEYYKATADRKWLRHNLPKLEKGIEYSTSHPKRWDPELGLVKRAYTIDTWDFTYEKTGIIDRRITPETPMAVMHGDNSGVFQAMNLLAWMNEELGHGAKARQWSRKALELQKNAFRHLWNGKYFTHQLPLGCPPIDDKEGVRLTLSNTYDINRGFTTLGQSRSIVEEYMHRRDTTTAFAEWFTIDPPYEPCFGEVTVHPANTYINGCITSFTAGELAKAAFSCGYEAYGWDILHRLYEQMVEDGGNIYFLYNRFSKKPEDAKVGPAAWGAAAVLSAIDEGLAGIQDLDCRYRSLGFSPRWPVTPYKELRYFSGYEINGDVVDVRYILTEKGMRYCVDSPARDILSHILLPEGVTASEVLLNGKPVEFREVLVAESRYVDFSAGGLHGRADIEILFSKPSAETVDSVVSWLERSVDTTSSGIFVRERYDMDSKQWISLYRPDCNIETAYAFLQCWRLTGKEKYLSLAREIFHSVSGMRNPDGSFPFADRKDLHVYTNDNSEVPIFIMRMAETDTTNASEYISAALESTSFLLQIQNEDGSWRVVDNDTSRTAMFTAHAVAALAMAARYSVKPEEYLAAVTRGIAFIGSRILPEGRVRTCCEEHPGTEYWRPPSSDQAICIRGIAMAEYYLGDAPQRKEWRRLRHKLTSWMDALIDPSGALRNGKGEGINGADIPGLTDNVYTTAFGMEAYHWNWLLDGRKKDFEALKGMIAFCNGNLWHSDDPDADGVFRGAYNLEDGNWDSSRLVLNSGKEGGSSMIYTGWANAPIVSLLMLTSFKKDFESNA